MTKEAILRVVGYLLAFAFSLVSIVANAKFAMTQGSDWADQSLYVVASVGADGLKITLLMFAAMLWVKNKPAALLTGLFWLGCLAWSGFSVVGWATNSAGVVVSEKDNIADRYAARARAVEDAEAALKGVAAHRSLGVVTELLQTAQGGIEPNRWRLSKQCTDITTRASADACAGYRELKVEEALALRGAEIETRLRTARELLDRTEQPVGVADPQAETAKSLAALIGWRLDAKTARKAVNVVTVLIIDVAAATLFTITMVATGGNGGAGAVTATRVALRRETAGGGKNTLQTKGITKTNYSPQITPQKPFLAVVGGRNVLSTGDPVALWAAARLSSAPGGAVTAGSAYKDFERWAVAEGHPVLDPVKFGKAAVQLVESMGGRKVKRRDARWFDGVALNEEKAA